MANPQRGEARLGDYTVAFNHNAICTLEGSTGLKMPLLLSVLDDDLGWSDLRLWLWAGLQKHHRGVTEETAGDILDLCGQPEATKAISDAVNSYLGPLAEKAEKANPPKAAA